MNYDRIIQDAFEKWKARNPTTSFQMFPIDDFVDGFMLGYQHGAGQRRLGVYSERSIRGMLESAWRRLRAVHQLPLQTIPY